MRINSIAPYMLDYCIQFLRTKVVGTKYRPEANTFLIDPRLLCRIIKNDGNLHKDVDRKDVIFCSAVVQEWIKAKHIRLPLGRGTYNIIVETGLDFAYQVKVRKQKLFGGNLDARSISRDTDGEISYRDPEGLDGIGTAEDSGAVASYLER